MKDKFEVNIDDTINSGQVFLWKKFDSKWYGINGKKILILEDKLDIKSKNIKIFLGLMMIFKKSRDSYQKMI